MLRTWKFPDRIAGKARLRVAAMYTASRIILWTILYGIPANAVDSTEARSPMPLAGMARCWMSATAVVDPVGRWRSKKEAKRAICRFYARAFEVAQSQAAKRVAEKYFCETCASAGAVAECKD